MKDPRTMSSTELDRELRQLRHSVACHTGRSNRPISGATLRQYERDLAKAEREHLRRKSAALPIGQRTVVRIKGTTFRLPALPPDDNDVVRSLQAQQEALLDAARDVKPVKAGWRPPSPRPPKPGDGTFEPAAGAPGSRVRLDGGEDAEVWSNARSAGHWATLDDGAVVLISGAHDGAHLITKLDRDWQREQIVAGVAKAREGFVARRLVPDDDASRVPWDDPKHAAWREARNAAYAWALASIRHQLYPTVWDAPAPFVDPRQDAA